jgi:hypothetical protein
MEWETDPMDANKKKNFRLFGIISPVDIIIVIALIAASLWAVLVFSAPTEVAGAGDRRIRYTVELMEKPAGFYEKAQPDTTLYDIERGYAIGTIVDSYALPYLKDAPDEAANIIRRTPVDGMEFSSIVVETSAQVADGSTMVGPYSIAVNKEVFVKSRDLAGRGYITSVEFLED